MFFMPSRACERPLRAYSNFLLISDYFIVQILITDSQDFNNIRNICYIFLEIKRLKLYKKLCDVLDSNKSHLTFGKCDINRSHLTFGKCDI